MPRLPTIRVMGSQAISTRPLASLVGVLVAIALPPVALVAGQELLARRTPLGFLVQRVRGDLPQPPDHPAIDAAGHGADSRAGWLVHEGHELVRETRHGAADADAADVRASTDPVDPAPL